MQGSVRICWPHAHHRHSLAEASKPHAPDTVMVAPSAACLCRRPGAPPSSLLRLCVVWMASSGSDVCLKGHRDRSSRRRAASCCDSRLLGTRGPDETHIPIVGVRPGINQSIPSDRHPHPQQACVVVGAGRLCLRALARRRRRDDLLYWHEPSARASLAPAFVDPSAPLPAGLHNPQPQHQFRPISRTGALFDEAFSCLGAATDRLRRRSFGSVPRRRRCKCHLRACHQQHSAGGPASRKRRLIWGGIDHQPVR